MVYMYSKEGTCMQCRMSKNVLNAQGIPFEEVKVYPTDEETLNELRSRGFTSFPIILPHGKDNWDDAFSGFNDKKIKALAK